MAIDPFIEGFIPQARPTVTSGSEMSVIEHLLQGVSIRTERQRTKGILPIVGSGRADHVVERNAYGQPKDFKDDEPFEELDRFDPVVFINVQDSLLFPRILSNVSLKDPEQLDGAIEPLVIRSRASLRSIDFPFESHDTRGELQDGNTDVFMKVSRMIQFVDLTQPLQIEPFIDSSEGMGTQGGDIVLPGFAVEDERKLEPFDESKRLNKTYVSGSLTDAVIENAILMMTGSNTDSFILDGHRSMGAGFTFDNNPEGTDSLAFGGFKR